MCEGKFRAFLPGLLVMCGVALSPSVEADEREEDAPGSVEGYFVREGMGDGSSFILGVQQWLSLYADGAYQWNGMTCSSGWSVSGKAILSGDTLLLQPDRQDEQQMGLLSLYLRRFEGRTILLEEYEVEAFDLLPSLKLGFVEILPGDKKTPEEDPAAFETRVRERFGAYPPEELYVEIRHLSVGIRKLRLFFEPAFLLPFSPKAWAEFLPLWSELQKPYDCPAPPITPWTLRLRWGDKERLVKLPASMKKMESSCDPGARLAAWLIKRHKADKRARKRGVPTLVFLKKK